MSKERWDALLYSDEEIHALCLLSDGFNDDINRNHRVREEDKSFSEFIDAGSTALLKEHSSLVKQLL